jgi:hypothetical protein
MHSLKELGYADYYYLDKDRIYNAKNDRYLKEVSKYRYKLMTKEGNAKSITMKEIYFRLFGEVFCKDNIKRLDGEVFKEIEGSNKQYYVSNYGRIISYMGNDAKILKPTITKNGYERLQIVIDGKKYNKFIHSLVAAAWLGQPKNLEQEIHHIDLCKTNNRADNLQYLSKTEHIKKHIKGVIENECAESEENLH